MNNKDELYHYGVKGMKWKNHRYAKAEKLYSRVGKHMAGYKSYKDLAKSTKAEYDNKAKGDDDKARLFEKQAKILEKKGAVIPGYLLRQKAEVYKANAEKIRKSGEDEIASYNRTAERYLKKAEKSRQKADAYATKKRVDLGKKSIDSIINKATRKRYERDKKIRDFFTESEATE